MDYAKLLTEQGRAHLELESVEGARLVDAIGPTLESYEDERGALQDLEAEVQQVKDEVIGHLNDIIDIPADLKARFVTLVTLLESGAETAEAGGRTLRELFRTVERLCLANATKAEIALIELEKL